jgi:tetratricopeptide (TPR) repeat protein
MSNTLSIVRLLSVQTLGQRKACKPAPTATYWFDRALAAEQHDDVGQAIVCYQRAIDQRPEFADAHNNLARLFQDRLQPRDLVQAEQHYRLAICAQPRNAMYWFNLGVVLEDQQQIGNAVQAYHQALQCDPQFVDAHHNLATLYARDSQAMPAMAQLAIRHLSAAKRLQK